jgi:hypothetical protein
MLESFPRLDIVLHPVTVAAAVTIVLLVGQLIGFYLYVAIRGSESSATEAGTSPASSPEPFVPDGYEPYLSRRAKMRDAKSESRSDNVPA